MSTPDASAQHRGNGFDVVLGNPPWERVKLQEQEFFAQRDPAIADAPNAASRKRAIAALKDTNRELLAEFAAAMRQADGESHLLRLSGRFPLCGRGDINTFSVFAELARDSICPTGRVGAILPSGLATGETGKLFFQSLVNDGSIVSLHSFENESRIFAGIHNQLKFALLTLTGSAHPCAASDFVFFARHPEDLHSQWRHFTLTADDFWLLNPNTGTCPIFRSERDARVTRSLYRRFPILWREGEESGNPWSVRFARAFDMATDSGLFRSLNELGGVVTDPRTNTVTHQGNEYRPLYEAKMVHLFDHRYGSYAGQTQAQANKGVLPHTGVEQHRDPGFLVTPRYWVSRTHIAAALDGNWTREWLMGWRGIGRNVDSRTMIPCLLPDVAVGHTLLLLLPGGEPADCAALCALMSSFLIDYIVRQKMDGTGATYFVVRQLPLPRPSDLAAIAPWDSRTTIGEWFASRMLELSYTSFDMHAFACDLGYRGPPFRWDEGRRHQIRCELDAAVLHLYGVGREDAEHVLDSFFAYRAKEEERHGGCFRSKQNILEIYATMSLAIDRRHDWQSELNPLPGDPRAAHDSDDFPPPPSPTTGGRPSAPPSPSDSEAPRECRSGKPDTKRASSIVDAFLAVREGRSADFVVCSAELNARFLAAARDLGEEGTDAELNRRLLSARKTNRLKDHPTTDGFTLPRQVLPYAFVAEWAARHLQRRMLVDHNEEVSLDDILCDPSLAAKFDECAGRIKPGVPPLHWRWAALAFRKTGRRRSLGTTAAFELRDAARQPLLFDAVPPVAGLYMLTANDRPIYVNETRDLHETIIRHAEVGGGELVPHWLLDQFPAADSVRWAALAGVNPDTLHEGRIRLVANERPWLNLVDALGAA